MAITYLTIRQKEGNNCSVHIGPPLSIISDVGCLLSVSFLVAQPQAGRQAEAALTAQGWISIISHSYLISSMTADWLQLTEHRHLMPI